MLRSKNARINALRELASVPRRTVPSISLIAVKYDRISILSVICGTSELFSTLLSDLTMVSHLIFILSADFLLRFVATIFGGFGPAVAPVAPVAAGAAAFSSISE